MSRKSAKTKETVLYPEDVGKAMQLLSKPDTVDPEAVVAAFAEVREETADHELARVVSWLRARACPTPATWNALLEDLERGAHRVSSKAPSGRVEEGVEERGSPSSVIPKSDE